MADENVSRTAPVVVVLSGAGGFACGKKNGPGIRSCIHKAPFPCWYAYCHIPGNAKLRLPDCVPFFLQKLGEICRQTRNKIILCGFSRGAAWVNDLVKEHATLWHVAVGIAGYPRTQDGDINFHEAREVMRVRRPVLYVFYAEDDWCSAAQYPQWFAEFSVAMARPPGPEYGDCSESFACFILPGTHNTGQRLWESMGFQATNHPQLVAYWTQLWGALQQEMHN